MTLECAAVRSVARCYGPAARAAPYSWSGSVAVGRLVRIGSSVRLIRDLGRIDLRISGPGSGARVGGVGVGVAECSWVQSALYLHIIVVLYLIVSMSCKPPA